MRGYFLEDAWVHYGYCCGNAKGTALVHRPLVAVLVSSKRVGGDAHFGKDAADVLLLFGRDGATAVEALVVRVLAEVKSQHSAYVVGLYLAAVVVHEVLEVVCVTHLSCGSIPLAIALSRSELRVDDLYEFIGRFRLADSECSQAAVLHRAVVSRAERVVLVQVFHRFMFCFAKILLFCVISYFLQLYLQ